jgi:hypothetical protein
MDSHDEIWSASKSQSRRGTRASHRDGARPGGSVDKTTRLISQAALLAAEAGEDGNGKDLVGYLKWVARKHPKLFLALLDRLLAMELMTGRMPPPSNQDMISKTR